MGCGQNRARRGRHAGALLVALALTAVACSKSEDAQTSTAAPSTQDALRTALAASDAVLNLDPPFVELGPIDQKPYQCGTAGGCQPQEQHVERNVIPQGVTNLQIAKFYLDNLAPSGWRAEGAFCDEGKNQYVVVASKRTNATKAYPGRFELFDKDKVQLRITMPAFGAESSFTVVPDTAGYPNGTCPANITAALDAARKAAEKNTPTTLKNTGTGVPGSGVPGSAVP